MTSHCNNKDTRDNNTIIRQEEKLERQSQRSQTERVQALTPPKKCKLGNMTTNSSPSISKVNQLIIYYAAEEMKPLPTVGSDPFLHQITALCPTVTEMT